MRPPTFIKPTTEKEQHNGKAKVEDDNDDEEKEEKEEEEEEEDYMTMTIPDPTTTSTRTAPGSRQPETSLQRRLRLRREAEARARPKSKAELAAEAEARREAALAQSLFTTQPKSKGLAMMARMGFTGGALGKKKTTTTTTATTATATREQPGAAPPSPSAPPQQTPDGPRAPAGPRTEPIRIEVRDGREGIGLESERKRKLREAAEAAGERAKRARAEEGEYRERMRREREEARRERQLVAAQRVAERMAGEREDREAEVDGRTPGTGAGTGTAARPLKAVPVVWRGLVRAREEAERDRRMRYDLEQGLSRLPTYDDPEEDEDDRKALGKAATTYVTAEDLDEEDPELEEFNALPAEEKLQKVVDHLREEHHYCFWCKFTYPDDKMEGCPGSTEEDHD